MPILLYQEEGPILEPKYLISILSQSVPIILVDWVHGDRIVADGLQQLISLHCPEVILDSHRMLFGNTARVQIWFPTFPDEHVSFTVWPLQSLELEFSNPHSAAFSTYVANKISSILKYKIHIDMNYE